MKRFKAIMLSAIVGMLVPTTLFAQAGVPKQIFLCSVGKKTASVKAVGNRFIYEFGTQKKTEISIIGSGAQGNVFFRAARYVGMVYQIRFTNGIYSYIIYSLESSSRSDHEPFSGLVVMKGVTRIAELSCNRYAEFNHDFDYDKLPKDTEEFSAM